MAIKLFRSFGLESHKEPLVLYHASGYKNDVLKPGFKHTGVLKEWDNGENNHFLYATTEKQTAIDLGVASAIEQFFKLDRFSIKGKEITIVSPEHIELSDLANLKVYLYTINDKPEEDWVKNDNPSNKLDTEYKTACDHVEPYSIQEIDVSAWLKTKKINIKQEK